MGRVRPADPVVDTPPVYGVGTAEIRDSGPASDSTTDRDEESEPRPCGVPKIFISRNSVTGPGPSVSRPAPGLSLPPPYDSGVARRSGPTGVKEEVFVTREGSCGGGPDEICT